MRDRHAKRNVHRPMLGTNLQRFGRDLTAEAASGKLDPLIGRENILKRAVQILSRRTKNNPVFIGDPGVGKTAIAEGIAQVAVSPGAPPSLRGRAIVSLDLGAIVSGTQYRGSFEERLQGIISDVQSASGRIILFIDEIHMLLEAGKIESASTNAANLLKPALARGELRCLGATTVEEYRRHIEADPALARRLQPIMVEEPSQEEAIAWLKALAPRYEAYHGVKFAEGVFEASVIAAQRFIPDRRQPDSAIDILDETAAMVHLKDAAIKLLCNDVVNLKEDQSQDYRTTSKHQNEISDSDRKSGWRYEHEFSVESNGRDLDQSRQIKTASCPHCGTPTNLCSGDALTVECPSCRYRFLNVPPEKLMLGSSLFLEENSIKKYQSLESAANKSGVNEALEENDLSVLLETPPLVEVHDVLHVIASAADVPFERVISAQSGWHALKNLEEQLSNKVFGQKEAVHAMATAVRLGAALNPRGKARRPLSAVLLHGPSASGKSKLCSVLAEAMFGTDKALISFDLSQATDKTSVARLIGAAPGYVGYGEGGALTEAVRRRPHSVILFESSHVAHADVLALLRQILEEGEIRDSMGRRADFRNAIVVLTVQEDQVNSETRNTGKTGVDFKEKRSSGNEELPTRNSHHHRESQSSMAAMVLDADDSSTGRKSKEKNCVSTPMHHGLPPEILNQLDAIIPFKKLERDDLCGIAMQMIDDVRDVLESMGVGLKVSNAALSEVVKKASSGAEGLQAIIRGHILGPAIDAAFQCVDLNEEVSQAQNNTSRDTKNTIVNIDASAGQLSIEVNK